jgi:hypothetical protein
MATTQCLRVAGKGKHARIDRAADDRPPAVEKALRRILMAAFDGSVELQRKGVTPRLRECINQIEEQAGVAAWVAEYCLEDRRQA